MDVLERTVDVDSHEMVPSHFWEEIFGPAGGELATLAEPLLRKLGGNDFYNPSVTGDIEAITDHNVWTIRGTRAPSAFDFSRRLPVMDAMGIEKQLVFPSFALTASHFLVANETTLRQAYKLEMPEPQIRALARAALDEYNEWAVRLARSGGGRMRPVAYVVDDGSVESLLQMTTDLINRGIRAINLPSGTPPGGVSPASPLLHPFWELLERNDITFVLHIGNETGFLASSAWGAAPAFAPGKVESHELGLEPYSMATLHFAGCNYLTTMTLGGVFELFPRLRFGVIESGCIWLGPLADNLDMWARDVHAARLSGFISMLPSEYLARNVRVTPFNNVERIEEEFLRYPHLQDCYCYSTDYPHIEGGIDIKRVFAERLAPLGDSVLQKFFRTNGELLCP